MILIINKLILIYLLKPTHHFNSSDSCLEELKTEEDSLYLKEGDQTFSPQNTQDKNTSKDLSESLHNCSNNQENMVDRGFGSLPQLSNGLPPLGPIKHPLGQLKGKPPHAASPSPDHMISLEQLPTPGRNFSPSPLQAKGGRRYSQNFKSPSKTLRFQNEYDSSDEEVEIEYKNDTHSLNIQKSKSDSAAGKEIEDSYNDPKAVTKSDFEDLKTKNLKTSTKTLAALKPSPILDKPVNEPAKITTTKSATTSKVANTTTKIAPSSVAQPVSSTVKQNDPKPAVSNSGNIKTTSASTTSSTTSTTTITTNKVLKTSATTSTAPATNKAPATTVSASNISTKQTTTASPAPKTNAPTKTTNATTPAQSKPITSVSTSSQAKTTPSTSKAISVVNKPTLSQTVSTMPPATGKSPVSAKIPSTVNNIVPNKESTIQKKTEPQLELESNLKIKRSNPMEILNAKFGNKSINKDLENSDEDSEDVRVDGAYGFLSWEQRTMRISFLKVRRIYSETQEELGLNREKQRLNLIEESLNLEKSMNELLQERQRELKKEHEKTMNRLKEDLSYSLERIHKEAENMEDTEKAHQLSRISFLKEKHKLEVENLQRIHHDFIENLRRRK
ncbi:hypothetical protein Avbf_00635 [Armadillidium vulgare]|nr:hypothetical protein Avbf_00635 [Armadillidium vulgare]